MIKRYEIMRKFKCISRKENAVSFWTDSFIVGKIYKEVEVYHKPNLLELVSEEGDEMFVDAYCFEEVSELDQEPETDLEYVVRLYDNMSDENKILFNRMIGNYE